MHVNENQLVGYCLTNAGFLSHYDASYIVTTLDKDSFINLQTALAKVLLDEQANGRVEVHEKLVERSPEYKSILYKSVDADGKTQKIVTFSFTDAAIDSFFPLLGLAVALFWHIANPVTAAQALSIVKILWSKLRPLKRPDDADAIEVLEALLQVRAKAITRADHELPTTLDILHQCGAQLSRAEVELALAKLNSKEILRIAKWGNQEGNTTHECNRWSVRF